MIDLLERKMIKKPLIKQSNVTQRCLGFWGLLYKREKGVDYFFTFGKDGQHIKRLLQTFNPVTLRHIMRLYFLLHKEGDFKAQNLEICFIGSAINRIREINNGRRVR